MLEFYPIEQFPCPVGVPVLVHLIDDRYGFANNQSDAWESCWIVQFPFKQPQQLYEGHILEWAPLSDSNQ